MSKSHHPQSIDFEESLFSEDDLYLFNEGTHRRLYEKLGAHPQVRDGAPAGTNFAVWAPNAEEVCVVGDFNGWQGGKHALRPRQSSGVWEGLVRDLGPGERYKFGVSSRHNGYEVNKADPFAFGTECPPNTASVVADLSYDWQDEAWMAQRAMRTAHNGPISIYEVHLGSWRRVLEDGNRSLSYRELADELVSYVRHMGFTHVELLPIMEHPFFGSWGYQTTSYFAPSSRFGPPQDLMYLIDAFHENEIGVILDWVPSHFPTDEHSLGYFDGTHLYEHADPRKGIHPDWTSYIFNYGRSEVISFLISSAMFWLDKYHADGLRVDAVASMLYLDYSRDEGEWIPNRYGGRENLEAINFLRNLNEAVYEEYPGAQTFAEESTAWPAVSRPIYSGGLGFGYKWDMGWMHDTLEYLSKDPVFRKFHHNHLTFRMLYAYSENYVLPLSHDEVVHGKGSLLGKMPGDDWQKFANLRLLFGNMYTQPAKKLLFMGGEIGQWSEWQHDHSVDWQLLLADAHAGIQRWVIDLNNYYRQQPALFERDLDTAGFEWIDVHDVDAGTLSFLRWSDEGESVVAVVCNFTPVPRHAYRVGVPRGGQWREALNSDAEVYGGSGQGNFGGLETSPIEAHGRSQSLEMTLPPLAIVMFEHVGDKA
jgi:1,4-alpha-glucan branching enzyme